MFSKLTVIAAVIAISTMAQAKPWLALDLNSWNTLKEMCVNFRDFGAQVPPEDIQVKCETTILYTEVVGNQTLTFPSAGSLTMSISSSKANVIPSLGDLNVAAVNVSCPVVAQVKRVSSGTFPSSCEELKNYPGTFVEFCLQKLSTGNYAGEKELVAGSQKSLCNKKQ